jgi:hypothetical protein
MQAGALGREWIMCGAGRFLVQRVAHTGSDLARRNGGGLDGIRYSGIPSSDDLHDPWMWHEGQ